MNGWNKKRWLDVLRKRHFKTWQIFCLLIFFVLLGIYGLRLNNLKMVELRNQVLVADETGNNLSEALENLNKHVFNHMNTEIVRPIELVHTYDRQAQTIIKASTQTVKNRDLYAEAARHCGSANGIFSESTVACTTNYIEAEAKKAGFGELPKINLPDKNRFIYSYASPLWTPDLAGISILISLILAVWFVLRIIERIVVVIVIRRRSKSGY